MALHGWHGVKTNSFGMGVLSCLVLGTACGSDATQQNTSGQPATPIPTSVITPAAGAAKTPVSTTPVTPVGNTGTSAAVPPPTAVIPPPASATPAAMLPLPGGAAGAPAVPAMNPTGTTTMPVAGAPMAMDECGLKTKYAGDEYCILPPPADKGFQLHIGPKNYDSPEAQYILAAGAELTNDFAATSSNDKEVYFYYRQYRQRTGAHHNIITSGGGGDSGLGQRIATFNVLSGDYPEGGVIAPENKGVGIQMPAHTSINVSLHSINTSEKPELREVWVNFWYRDPSEVTDPVKEVFAIAPMSGIPPGGDVMVNGSCATAGAGRMLWAYGHRHANNVRFSVWHNSGGKKDLVYQAYNWEEPITFDYSSTVMNPVPDTGPMVEGGWSGPLAFKAGDSFSFECHVVNKTQGTLNFTNNTYTGEMCILDAETVGAGCN